MKLEQIPPPERVTSELMPVLKVLYTAIEVGIMRAVEFFDELDKPLDTSLAPNLVRYHAKEYLDGLDEKFFEVESFDLERQELGNNGLLVTAGDHQIRILKSDNGRVPVPGASQLKKDYYQQPLPLIAMPDPAADLPPLRLIALWDTTPKTYNFLGLTLALPSAGGEDRASVHCHWYSTIDAQAIASPSIKVTTVMEEAATIDEEEDLPISKVKVQKNGTNEPGGESA